MLKVNLKENLTIHLIIKNKDLKEEKSELENEEFIREIEIILTPVKIKFFIFYFFLI